MSFNIPGVPRKAKPAANESADQKANPSRGRVNYNSQPKNNNSKTPKSIFDLINISQQAPGAGKKEKREKNVPTDIVPNSQKKQSILDKSALGGPRLQMPPVIANRLDTSVTIHKDLSNNIGQLSLQGSGILLDALDGRGISAFRPEIISSFDFIPAFIGSEATEVKKILDILHDAQILRDENVRDVLLSMQENDSTKEYLDQIIVDYEKNIKKAKDDLSFLSGINQKLEQFKKALNIKNFVENEIGFLSSFIVTDQTRKIHSYTPMEFIKNYLFIDQEEFQKLSATALYNQLCFDFHHINGSPVAYRNSRFLSNRDIISSIKINDSSISTVHDFLFDVYSNRGNAAIENALRQASLRRQQYSELSQQEVRSAAGRQLAAQINVFNNSFNAALESLNVLDVNHITKFSLCCYHFANEISISSAMGDKTIQEVLQKRFNIQTFSGYKLFDQVIGVPGPDIFSPNVSSAQGSCLSFSKIESNTFTVLPFEQVLLKHKAKGYIPGTRQYVESVLSNFDVGLSNVNSFVTAVDNAVSGNDEIANKVFSFDTTQGTVIADKVLSDILTFIGDIIPSQNDVERTTSFIQEVGMFKIPSIDSSREVHLFKLAILAAFYQTSIDSSPPPILRELLSQFSANDLNLAEHDINSNEFISSKAINFSQLPTIVRAIIRTINDISVFSREGRTFVDTKSELQQDGGVGLQCLFDQYNPVIAAIQNNTSLFGLFTKVLKQIPDDVQEFAILSGKTRQNGTNPYSLLLLLFKGFMQLIELMPDLSLTLSSVNITSEIGAVSTAEVNLAAARQAAASADALLSAAGGEQVQVDFSEGQNRVSSNAVLVSASRSANDELRAAQESLETAQLVLSATAGRYVPSFATIPIDGTSWYTITFNSGILKDAIIDALSAIMNTSSQTSTRLGGILILAYKLVANADSISIQHFTLINSILKNIRDKGKEFISFFNNKDTKDRMQDIVKEFNVDKSFLISKEFLIQSARALDEVSPKINKIKDLILNLDNEQDVGMSTSTFLDDTVVSDFVYDNLNSLLVSLPLSKQQAANGKILTIGLPVGITRHIKEHPRSINDDAPIDSFIATSQIDLINVCVYRRDIEFDSIVFKPMKFIFETSRFLDNASLSTMKESYDTLTNILQEVKTNSNIISPSAANVAKNAGLNGLYGVNGVFGKNISFPKNNAQSQRNNNDILSQDENIFLPNSANTVDHVTVNEKYTQSVSDIISNVDYSILSHDQIRSLISNHYKSYLLSTMIRMLTGVDLRDATFTLNENIDDSDEKERFQELINQYVVNLYNLSLSRDERAKELIKIATNSSLVDIVMIAEEIASKTNLGNASTVSLKQDVTTMLRLFNANSILTPSSSIIKKIFAPKLFERVFSVYVDPDEFEIDIEKTVNDPINDAGRFMYDMIKANNASANDTGVSILEVYENNTLMSAKLIKPAGERVEMVDYFITIETII